MNLRVGDREHIASASLLVPNGEDAWIEFKADSWNVKLNVIFIDDDASVEGFNIEGKDDFAIITLKNWKNSLPMAIETPYSLGEINGKKIVFLFTGYCVGTLKKIDFSFVFPT